MNIIPAIDILNGKCVRLSQGDYASSRIYEEQPLEIAKAIEAAGIGQVHLVDLDGARSRHIVNHEVLREIATKTNLKIDFGGGLKSKEDLDKAFDCGAAQLTIGSIAISQPELFLEWLGQYGAGKIILGADCRDRQPAGQGWLDVGGPDIVAFIKGYNNQGVSTIICTDIAKDGMLQGPSFALYEEIVQTTKVQLIASGGIASLQDLQDLKQLGCSGAIIGKALYEGYISLENLSTLC